jgi:iron-sulfur cluster repair protein YtfE (RIC family)
VSTSSTGLTIDAPTGLIPRTELPTKLISYAALHDAIVRDLRRLELLALARQAGGAPGITRAATERWWTTFVAAIEHHHHREDDLVFPLLQARGAELDLVTLASDHDRLDELMAATGAALATLDDGPARAGELVDAATALRAHMDDHLAREEAMVFPEYDRVLSDADHEATEKRMRDGMTMRDFAFTVPWVLDDAHPRVDAQLHADAPAVLVLLERFVWRRGYVKLAAPIRRSAR